jgi:hypothetical protein
VTTPLDWHVLRYTSPQLSICDGVCIAEMFKTRLGLPI